MTAAMRFKAKLRDPSRRLTAHICTIPSAAVTQAIAAAGADAVVVDLEHGAIDYAAAHAMIAATAGTDCAPLVRVTKTAPEDVKRVLDLGAEGIVFPLIRGAGDARAAVASLRYPPEGTRGFGPFLAQSRWGTDLAGYRAATEAHLVCGLLVETRDAVADIDAICAVRGVDFVVPAQFDLSTDLGVPGQFDHPDFVDAIAEVERAATAAGLPLGNVGLARAQAEALFERGYRLIAGFDVLWLRAMAAEAQSWTR